MVIDGRGEQEVGAGGRGNGPWPNCVSRINRIPKMKKKVKRVGVTNINVMTIPTTFLTPPTLKDALTFGRPFLSSFRNRKKI